jgi:hypothetical protein
MVTGASKSSIYTSRCPAAPTKPIRRSGGSGPGKLGRINDRGYLYFEGRTANVLQVKRYTISTAKVESVLKAQPEVWEAAVVVRSHEVYGEVVEVFVRSDAEGPTHDDVVEHATDRLADSKDPATLTIIEEFPWKRSGNNQVSRMPHGSSKTVRTWHLFAHRERDSGGGGPTVRGGTLAAPPGCNLTSPKAMPRLAPVTIAFNSSSGGSNGSLITGAWMVPAVNR